MSVETARFQFSYLSPTQKTFVNVVGDRDFEDSFNPLSSICRRDLTGEVARASLLFIQTIVENQGTPSEYSESILEGSQSYQLKAQGEDGTEKFSACILLSSDRKIVMV